jgi:alpha-L-rhamnosidase
MGFFNRAPWRNRPAFCLDLRITYVDGTVETIPSNLSWKKSDSPVIFNSIYTGEHYDARLEQEGWSKPGFDDSQWQGVGLRSTPSQNYRPTIGPIRMYDDPRKISPQIDEKTYV